jgi:hypothetical protein
MMRSAFLSARWPSSMRIMTSSGGRAASSDSSWKLKRASRCIISLVKRSRLKSWPSPVPTLASSAISPIKRMMNRALSTRPRSLKNSISD